MYNLLCGENMENKRKYKRERHLASFATIYLINNTLASADVGFKVDTTSICGAMPLNNSLHLQDVNNYSKNECGQPFKANNPFFHTNKKIDTKNKFSVYLLSISYGILIGRFLNRELGNLRISPSRDLCRIRIECQRIFYTITYNFLTGCRFFSFQHGV